MESRFSYGKLFAKRIYSAENGLLQEVLYKYEEGKQWGGMPDGVLRPYRPAIPTAVQNVRMIETKITEYDAGNNTSSYITRVLGYDEYDMPTLIHQYNDFSDNQRYIKKSYYNDTKNWLLSLPRREDISSNNATYLPITETNYHSADSSYPSLPNCQLSFGSLVSCNRSYFVDGNVSRVDYSVADRWVKYSSYRRGIAQRVTSPKGTSNSPKHEFIIVDENGWITGVTDFNGNCTNYKYDAMGRLTLIDPCDSQWADTSIKYFSHPALRNPRYPVYIHKISQTITRGDYSKVIDYDLMMRPVKVIESDHSDREDSPRSVRTVYNYNNQPTFTSFKYKPFDSGPTDRSSHGIHASYDALGRVIQEDDNTVLGSIDYSYLGGNRVRVHDNKGNVTTTTYLAYDSPTLTQPTLIESPESVSTSITYNLRGKPTGVLRHEQLREMLVYDEYNNLCKVMWPDIGNMAFSYNKLGELQWKAHGNSVDAGLFSCDFNVNTDEKVEFSYDNTGNIIHTKYGDGSSNKQFTYDNNNNVKQIVSGSGTQNYEYNSLNSLTSEKLTIDGKTFSLNYGFDTLGNMNHVTYPSGRSVSIVNNALGQIKQMGNYVTDASYHPTGAIKDVSLGNGVSYRMSIDYNRMPRSISVAPSSGELLAKYLYFYDGNRNLVYIDNPLDTNYDHDHDIELKYDGLDRLTNANGYWGSGVFKYDAMGNILSKQLGNEVLNYHYNAVSKMLTSTSGAKQYSFGYDGRGNVIENGFRPFNYNLANQLVSSGGINFTYDGHDRRVKKSTDGNATYSMYSASGKLMYLQRPNGDHVDHLYLEDKLITTVESR